MAAFLHFILSLLFRVPEVSEQALSQIKTGCHLNCFGDSLFFHISAGRTDVKRGIRVLQLCGKPACHL